jgi:probable F420-dependent oxidoreductase
MLVNVTEIPMSMRLGICLPQQGSHSDGSRVADFARAAEALGYESLWVSDRLLAPLAPSDLYPGGGTPERPYPPHFTSVLDPLLTLTAAAVATSTARLGTSTVNATWYQPMLLGRALTTLDSVSDGRLDVGFGVSWLKDEYDAVGVPWQGRGARLEEILDVLATLWTTNPVEHKGELFRIPASRLDLRPVQPGGPPVLLGGLSVGALERVGRRADGWLGVWGVVPQEVADMLWLTACRVAESADRDPAVLRREMRINVAPGQSVAEVVAICDRLEESGVDGAFVDLIYATGSIEESLDVAAELMHAWSH